MKTIFNDSRPRVLLLGDYSNCHRSLYLALKRRGWDVTQMSAGSSWMDIDREIDISRSPGKIGGLKLYVRARYGDLARQMRGYDIVAIHDLNFLQLKPVRLRELFDKLKRGNGSIFYTAMSTDIAFLDMLEAEDSPLRYSEWFIDGRPSPMYQADPSAWDRWHQRDLVDYQRYALDNIDGAVSALYEYHLGMERALGADRVFYGGIPIDLEALGVKETPVSPGLTGKVKLFLGRDRYRVLQKGSDLLLEAARRVTEARPRDVEFKLVENLPFNEFKTMLNDSHIVLDQVYSYTPATTALMAMAIGHVTVSGAEPEYYDFIGAGDNRPIVNAPLDVDELTRVLLALVDDRDRIAHMSRRSREFLLKHNASDLVADRFIHAWLSKI